MRHMKFFIMILPIWSLLYSTFSLAVVGEEKQGGGRKGLRTPLLEEQRRLAGKVHSKIYEVKEGVLSIPYTALEPALLQGINPREVTGICLEKPEKAMGFTVDMIRFIQESFPSLQMLHIGSLPLSLPANKRYRCEGFIMPIVAAQEIGKLVNLTILRAPGCKLESHGVLSLSGLVNLVEVDFNLNDITDEGAAVFRNFPKLKILNLWNNRLTEASLKELEYLEELEELYLGGNKIGSQKVLSAVTTREVVTSSGSVTVSQTSVTVPQNLYEPSILAPLARLKSLIKLDLQTTQNKGFITPRDLLPLAELVNLQILNISTVYSGYVEKVKNHPLPLSGRPTFLENLVNLRELIANDSGIEDEGLRSIGTLTNLEELYLGSGLACNIGIPQHGDPRRMTKMASSGNVYQEDGYQATKLNGTGLRHLLPLKKLRVLVLKKHFLGDNANSIGNLTSLERLDLYDCFLTARSLALFGNLTNLVSLDLARNNIGTGTRHLSSLHKLEKLRLRNCNINDEAFEHLARLRSLKNLDIEGPYCELTPLSIPNITTFVTTKATERFNVGTPFFSEREKNREIERERPYGGKDFIWASRKTVWTRANIQDLFNRLPAGYDFGRNFIPRSSLTSSNAADGDDCDCCVVS